MFQNKNTSNDQNNSDFPIHTMQQDLAEIKNPGARKEPAQNDFLQKAPSPQKVLNETQKSSPFLNPALNPVPAPRPIQAPTPQLQTSLETAPLNAPRTNWPAAKEEVKIVEDATGAKTHIKPVLLIVSVVFILLIAGGGGYYFWMTRQPAPQDIVNSTPVQPEPTQNPTSEPMPEPVPEPLPPTPQFSTDKPNYLNIDIATADSTKIQTTLKKYVADVLQANIKSPVEFIVTDLQNNPVTLTTFATQAGIDFSSTLLLNSANTFSLFVYADQGNLRLALAIDAKDEALLKNALRAEETKLATEITPLFLDVPNTPSPGVFGSSTYKEAAIRYRNIVSPSELSVDYTVFKKKLIIGTTKMTLRSVIDYIETSSAVIPAAVVPTNSTVSNNTTPAIQTVPATSTTAQN